MNDELVWRPPALGDVPDIRQIATRCDEAAETLDAVMIGELANRLEWDGGISDVSRVAFEGERLVAAGWVRMMAAPSGVRACLHAFAEPGHAAGPELIRWLNDVGERNVYEARFERILGPATADLPAGELALYGELGFERFYTELEMARSTTMPAGERIRSVPITRWDASLHGSIREAYNDAFAARGSRGYTPNQWERAFAPDDDFRAVFSFVALDRDQVVGFLFADVRDHPDGWSDPTLANCGWIDSLGVRPSHQRRAVGGQLIAAACEAMKDAGAARVALRVNEENEPAMSLYRRLGFATVRKHVVHRRMC